MAKMPQKHMIAILVVVIVLILGGCGTGIFLLYQKNQAIMKDVTRLSGKNNELEKIEREAGEKEKEKKGLDSLIDQAAKILPYEEEADVEGFGRLYTKFVRQSGVINDSLSALGATIEQGQFTRYRYQAEIRGKIDEIAKFFNLIESHVRFFKIDQFKVSIMEQPGVNVWPKQNDLRRCSVIVSIYTFKEQR